MGCGRPSGPQAAAAPVPPPYPAPPAPPAYAPGQVHTPPSAHAPGVPAYAPGVPAHAPGVPRSDAGPFLRRTFCGDWVGAAKVAVWPTALLLVLAAIAAIPGGDRASQSGAVFSDRLRVALAVLLKGLGGGFALSIPGTSADPADPAAPSGPFSSGLPSGLGWLIDEAGAQATLSVAPLTVTLLWLVALVLGARRLRRTLEAGAVASAGSRPGIEAALRIAVLAASGVLALALFAQPTVDGVSLSSSPFGTLLCTPPLAALAAGAVLGRRELDGWLDARPGRALAARALRTALAALAAVVSLSALVAFAVLGVHEGDVTGYGLLLALLVLPNLGAAGLGLSWGAPLKYDWWATEYDNGHQVLGLSQIGDAAGGWAEAGCLVLGAVCALLVGAVVARRSRDLRERLLAGGCFLVLFCCLAALSGFRFDGSSRGRYMGVDFDVALAPSVPDALLLGALWVFGAVLLVPLLRPPGAAAVVPGAAGTVPWAPPVPTHQPRQQPPPSGQFGAPRPSDGSGERG